jgi:hypothetical protein
VGGVAMFDA